MAVGSTAGGIKDATDNEVVKVVAKGVEKGAEKVQKSLQRMTMIMMTTTSNKLFLIVATIL